MPARALQRPTDAAPQRAHPAVAGLSHLGNQAAQRLLRTNGLPLQAKLTVNTPGDAFEREADRIADAVVRGTSVPSEKAAGGLLGATATRPHVQRACSCGKPSVGGGECADCRKKREEGVQRATASGAPASSQVSARSAAAAPAIVRDVIGGGGRPLDATTRSQMETRFGANFAHVRIHADVRAAASARAVNAHAYTVGAHIAFDAGRFAPGTRDGQRLLAHELAHVVQQTGAGREGEAPVAATADAPIVQRYAHDDSCPQDFLEEYIWPGDHLAKQMLPKAIKQLNSGRPLMDKIAPIYFGKDWRRHRNDITVRLNETHQAMEKSDYTYECEDDCEATDDNTQYAYVRRVNPFNTIHLCMNTIRSDKNLRGFAQTLIHELSHEFAGTDDPATGPSEACDPKDSEIAANTAECLARFAAAAFDLKD